MTFSFPKEDVYRIEKSVLLSKVHLKATECIVSKQGKLVFIEAKCSTPRPQNQEQFEQFMSDALRLWNISDTAVKVINDQMALDGQLIVASK